MRALPLGLALALVGFGAIGQAQTTTTPTAATPTATVTAEPVRHVPVFVSPYSAAGATPQDAPKVAVAKAYDAQLASSKVADIQAVAQAVRAQPGLITPMTLMVLAIRHYDVGLRDESVFWFYAAKDRYLTLREVADLNHPGLSQVRQATTDFANLAGLTINGHAFCNLARQQAARQRALAWVEANPYDALFLPQIPARPGDRRDNLALAIKKLKDDAAKESESLAHPAMQAQMRASRLANQADLKYCWP